MKNTHLLLILLAGCSSMNSEPASETVATNISGSVYLSKSSILRPPAFEQHVIRDGKIFSECGSIKKGKLIIEDQKMGKVDSQLLARIKKNASELQQSLKDSDHKFQEPPQGSKVFDQGIAKISLDIDGTKTDIKTTLASISEPGFTQEMNASRLIQKIRKAAPSTCGRISFFGIKKG